MKERIKQLKVFACDVDGVLTDGKIIYDSKGAEVKQFNAQDGFGFVLLKKAGIQSAIITGKSSPIVTRRAKGIGIDKLYQDADPKITAYKKLLRHFNVQDDEVCFIGDDLLDVQVLKRVGFAVAVPNAVQEVKQVAHYITQNPGGAGAVREVIELILKTQNKWQPVISRYE